MFSNQVEDGRHNLPQGVDLRCREAERAAGRHSGAVVASITVRRSRDAALAGVVVVSRVAWELQAFHVCIFTASQHL